ncbi:hypothetical protein FOZ62_011185, partial [Perkinsus olseni]
RAKIADIVDEWVTANGAPHRLAANQPLSHRRHFVGQRVRLKIFHGNNAPARKLLPKWQADWYIFKFVAGSNNKTVVVRHFPDMKEKVISTDYILADPVQPDIVPAQLNIVRMDPPVNEAPVVPLYPLLEVSSASSEARGAPSDRSARDEASSDRAEVGSPLSAVQGEAPVYWVAQDRGNPLGSPAIPAAPSVAAPSVPSVVPEVRSPQLGDVLVDDAFGPDIPSLHSESSRPSDRQGTSVLTPASAPSSSTPASTPSSVAPVMRSPSTPGSTPSSVPVTPDSRHAASLNSTGSARSAVSRPPSSARSRLTSSPSAVSGRSHESFGTPVQQNVPADVVEPVPPAPVAESVQPAQPPLRVTRTGR